MLLVPSRVGAILNVDPSSNLKGCKIIGVKVSHQTLKRVQGLSYMEARHYPTPDPNGLLVGFGDPIFKCVIEFSVTLLSKFHVSQLCLCYPLL